MPPRLSFDLAPGTLMRPASGCALSGTSRYSPPPAFVVVMMRTAAKAKTRTPATASRNGVRTRRTFMSARVAASAAEDADDLAHGAGGVLQLLELVLCELELDDLLDPAAAELHRHADVEAVDPVLTLEVRRARQHPLLVEHDGVHHLCSCRARRVPRGRAEQLHDLAASL